MMMTKNARAAVLARPFTPQAQQEQGDAALQARDVVTAQRTQTADVSTDRPQDGASRGRFTVDVSTDWFKP